VGAVSRQGRRALDREGLTCSSLPVGEDGPIVALDAAVCDWLGNLVEYGLLVEGLLSNKVEIVFSEVVSAVNCNLLAAFHLNAFMLALRRLPLSIIERSDSNTDLDVVFRVVEDSLSNVSGGEV